MFHVNIIPWHAPASGTGSNSVIRGSNANKGYADVVNAASQKEAPIRILRTFTNRGNQQLMMMLSLKPTVPLMRLKPVFSSAGFYNKRNH